jgi:hypothetical protein
MPGGKTWTRKVSKSGGYLVLSDAVNPPGRTDPVGEITIQKGDVGTDGARIIYTRDNTFTWDATNNGVAWKTGTTAPPSTNISASVSGAALTITDHDTDTKDTSYEYYLKASDGTGTKDPTIHNRT